MGVKQIRAGSRHYSRHSGESNITSRRAYILQPSTHPLMEYVAYGFFSMEEVLHIPSDRLEWIDDENPDILKILEERFPCDHDSFTRVNKYSAPNNNFVESLPHSPSTCIAIFTNPAFNDRGERCCNNKDILDALYKEAKRRPVVIISSPWTRKGRLGYIEGHEYPAELGSSIQVLRFDRVKWNEERQKRKKTHRNQEILPRGYVTVYELREIAEAMGGSLREGLEKEIDGDGWFRLELKWGIRTKKELCQAIVKLYKLGRKAFGKSFWKNSPSYRRGRWDAGRFVYHYVGKDVVARWKKEKRKPPEDKRALEIWKIIQEVAKAKKTKNPKPYR